MSFAFVFLACAPSVEKPLETVKVTRGDILAELSTTGIVIPRNRLEIKPPVSGRIESVLVVEGQKVKQGTVLAWMSSSERAALLDAARSRGVEEYKYWENVYKPAPIIAPLAGFVINRNMEPGQYFNTSDAVLVMADQLIVEAQVDETDIGSIKLHQKAVIVLDAYADKKINGYVEQIAYESETVNNVVVYQVNIRPLAVPSYFRSGMSATVNFLLKGKKDVLMLPQKAVKNKNQRSYVFRRENGKVIALPVQTGMEGGGNIEIVSGMALGEEVLIPNAKIIQELLGDNHHPPFNFLGKKK